MGERRAVLLAKYDAAYGHRCRDGCSDLLSSANSLRRVGRQGGEHVGIEEARRVE